ncbi:MAG: helicase RepA family protein [Ruminococcus sp.]|nr:helicase RepA family protein [Ruminococcus sp.]
MTTPLKPIEFCVDGMISTGLFILAGAPKVGKSWLTLDMALSIAKGEKLLGRETERGTALYLCLEDSYARIQNRLFELTSEPSENLHFAIMAGTLGGVLEKQIEQFKSQHTDLKIIIIDTLQKIRSDDDTSYAADYKELSILKNLADKLRIAILLVHHTRKCRDNDPFNMISGTTGISGCVDGSMVMIEKQRGSGEAVLHCVGRDIENLELHLKRNGSRWVAEEKIIPKPRDTFSFMIHDFMLDRKYFKDSATALVNELKMQFGIEIPSNKITQNLVQHGMELKTLGVTFEVKRSCGQRFLILKYDRESDSSDGCSLWVEIAVTAVTPYSANALPMRIDDSDGSSGSDGTTIK